MIGNDKKELGRKIVIPADAEVTSGITGVSFHTKTYELRIGIGKDHTASLFIDEDALEALQEYKHNLSI